MPAIKGRIRELSVEGLEEIVDHCTQLSTAVEIDAYLADVLGL
ncbi:MAG: hypothetical protein AAFX50_02240 [Acidobacteriota bacterium]